jgi:uncharacterized LabA/DUF88 family protein
MPEPLRAALYLDFDNVVSGLAEGAGPAIAERFATEPALWLAPLMEDRPRRTLLRRCYMNPAGAIIRADGTRAYFSTFRYAFQAMGFEVVDCPRLTRLKNAADLRIALDVMDALAGPVRLDEFTIMSSDADFVPLLLRLRTHDRTTRLVAHPDVGRIVRAAADDVIGLDALATALGWQRDAPDATPFGHDAAPDVMAAITEILADQNGPVHLPHLGQMLVARTGLTLRSSDYAGTGSLEALIATLPGWTLEPGAGGGTLLPPGWQAE